MAPPPPQAPAPEARRRERHGRLTRARALAAFALAASAALALFAACTSDDTRSSEPLARDASAEDVRGDETTDAGADARDAASDAADAPFEKDANGPGEAGAPCSFNRECNAALRCECSETVGCACAPGPRGTGKIGVDGCDSGNDCASAVCVEGPGSAYYCSDECATGAECKGALPVCATIAFVGRICIRDAGR